MTDAPMVAVSWGELIDKMTILEIKQERIGSAEARANVAREYRLLQEGAAQIAGDDGVLRLRTELKSVNEALWEIEDALRAKEAAQDFGADFVRLARSVYQRNDERAALKRELNALLKSELVEEKSYFASGTNLAAAS